MDKMYRLRYQGKWMKVKHMLGTYTYDLCDDPEEVELMREKKAKAWRSMLSVDNQINIEDIELVET